MRAALRYKDVTKTWLEKATPNSHRVALARYFEDDKGIRHYVDNKYVKHNNSKREIEVAYLLEKTFGGEISLLPEVVDTQKMKCADYLWNGEKWDLKGIRGIGKNNVDDKVKDCKKQAHCFIIDNTRHLLPYDNVLKQCERVFINNYRIWVQRIMIVDGNDIKCILERQ